MLQSEMINDLADKLSSLGLCLSLRQDTPLAGRSFLDTNPIPEITRVPKDASFIHDCDIPYAERRFTNKNKSLFLYLHPKETLLQYLSKNEKSLPDCSPASKLAGFLKEQKRGEERKVLSRLQSLGLAGMDAIDAWFSGMLTRTFPPESLPFFRENDAHVLRCIGSTELYNLYDGVKVLCGLGDMANPGSLSKLLYSAIDGLEKFIALHELTWGGEITCIDRLKTEFFQRFGASEPAAFYEVFPGEAGTEILLIHAKDVSGFASAERLHEIAQRQARSSVEPTWSWQLRHEGQEEVIAESGGYGHDFSEMERDIERVLEAMSPFRPTSLHGL